MNKIVKIFHPDWTNSQYTKKWLKDHKSQLVKDGFQIDIHQDGEFDITKEQKILKIATEMIFVFPMFWYNPPWNAKKYLDVVLEYKMNLSQLFFKLVVFCGQGEEYFKINQTSVIEIMDNFTMSFNFLKANYTSLKSFYGCVR